MPFAAAAFPSPLPPCRLIPKPWRPITALQWAELRVWRQLRLGICGNRHQWRLR